MDDLHHFGTGVQMGPSAALERARTDRGDYYWGVPARAVHFHVDGVRQMDCHAWSKGYGAVTQHLQSDAAVGDCLGLSRADLVPAGRG